MISKIIDTIDTILKNDKVKKVANDNTIKSLIFGNYSDGSSRNLVDSILGEYLSPKQKKKYNSKKNKNKKPQKFKIK